jgi:hypothetical protein
MGKASGMIAIPAKLCSDFILIPGTAIHIALEHTLHIAGIPTETLKTSTAILTVGSAV